VAYLFPEAKIVSPFRLLRHICLSERSPSHYRRELKRSKRWRDRGHLGTHGDRP